MAQTVIDSLLRSFPHETTEAMLETYLRKEKGALTPRPRTAEKTTEENRDPTQEEG